jgi:dTDP-glucose 4,6-dehydratase
MTTDSSSGMRLLVTGGAGFIGSNFVRYLLKIYENVEVVTLDALTYAGSKANLEGVREDPRHRFVEGDIRDDALVADLMSDVDFVVNFAAESHVDRAINGAAPFVATNVEGTRTLLDAAVSADIERFLQISTDEVYGEVMEGCASEDSLLEPQNPYAATKAAADHLALSYQTTHGLPVLVTRTCNNYGPGQNTEKLIPKFITSAAAGVELPVYGDGSNVREWIYVRDNCRALNRVLRDGDIGNIYNVGTGDERSTLEVTHAIVDGVEGADEDQITFIEDRPGHDQRYAVATEKIEALGWQPAWAFEDGLTETIDYYIE